ncbi:MAG: hypothetical protein ACLP3B_23090 [Syntrophobacteraceae bacterium]
MALLTAGIEQAGIVGMLILLNETMGAVAACLLWGAFCSAISSLPGLPFYPDEGKEPHAAFR